MTRRRSAEPPGRAQAVEYIVPALDDLRAELGRARAVSRAWSESFPEEDRNSKAAVFANRALHEFARFIAPQAHSSWFVAEFEAPLDGAGAKLAEAVGRDAAKLPLLEGLHFLTSFYPALLPSKQRGALGAFYTPPVLASRLLEHVTEEGLDWGTARVLDPAAGGGVFLLQAAQRMREALIGCEPAFVLAQIGSRLLGLEVDPNAAQLAQNALAVYLADLSLRCGRATPTIVRTCDTLNETPHPEFDLVIGNPPYGRVTLSLEQRRLYARSLYGHANLYGVFTDNALRWTKSGGLIAFLTPTSFLAGQYYSALRKLLASEAPPIAIDFVHARRGVFEDVLQETLLAVYQKDRSARRAQIHYLHVKNEVEASITKNGTIALPEDRAAPWLAPRSPGHSSLIRRLESMKSRLGDWGYSVSTGPLVWNRYKTQLREKDSGDKTIYPLIWAEAVTADGKFIFRAQKKNHAPFFKLERRDDWLLIKNPCVLVQRTTAKEQARRLIAAELPAVFVKQHGGVVIENHLNMVRSNGNPKVPASALAAILNSEVLDQVFRCMNGSVAVSAFELEAIPFPDACDLESLKSLIKQGAGRDSIEAECARLYGRL